MKHEKLKAYTIAFWIVLMPLGLIFYYKSGLVDLPFIFLFIIISNVICFVSGAYAQHLDNKEEEKKAVA